ncbi:MAG: 3-deoxy-8-phosphooctulonate synthase [Alphaproteobacteria bacterium CG_4_10_14_0_8_um_filter_37_21]|nr:MAG: 3-deoxy-8-phosphooctulonate synthase [Alphaproteobacteria bacterium CG_4_10_14_0_8_um_filter_37_21]
MQNKIVPIDGGPSPLSVANNLPFMLIAGPCVMESRDHILKMAEALKKLTDEKGVGFVFKASFDKANRTSVGGARGLGIDKGLKLFEEVKKTFNVPVITDIHDKDQCAMVAEVVDILQIPAFLCRQTDLLEAAAKTGKPLNIKKGQFLAPWDMVNVVKKVESFGNHKIMLCERGASFGYNTLVTDMRGLPTMAKTGYPVIFDATHSCQQPGGQGGSSGGQREFAPVLARAAIAVGVAGVFAETHDNPDQALSDGPNMIPLHEMAQFIDQLKAFDNVRKNSGLV